MDFQTHLQVLRFCKTVNITKPQLIRQIYQLIKEHEGKDFKDINDLIQKLYPPRHHLKRRNVRRRPHNPRDYKPEEAMYETPSTDETS